LHATIYETDIFYYPAIINNKERGGRMRRFQWALAAILILIPSFACASSYTAFQQDLSTPYTLYKKALMMTGHAKHNQEEIKAVLEKSASAWQQFAEKYKENRPETYAKIEKFAERISRPAQISKEALAAVQDGKAHQAHKTLEPIRYLLWEMRVEAGISPSLSDKVNDFHEAMEVVLGGIAQHHKPEGLRHLNKRYGTWLALKWKDIGNAPEAKSLGQQFQELISEGTEAISQLKITLNHGNAKQAAKAAKRVKKSFKKIFFLPECH